LWDWGVNSGLHAYKSIALQLESYLQSILLWLFCRWGLKNYQGWPWIVILPFSDFQEARITDVSHQHPAQNISFLRTNSRPVSSPSPITMA
jgi:hypothetical protein